MSEIVKLNVGGVYFETTRDTLSRDPDSMLARMIEQANEKQLIARGKDLSIDRDGSHFGYILNYLRDGDNAALPIGAGNGNIREWLIQEASFFQLPGLITLAKSKTAFKAGDVVKLTENGDYKYTFLQHHLQIQ